MTQVFTLIIQMLTLIAQVRTHILSGISIKIVVFFQFRHFGTQIRFV